PRAGEEARGRARLLPSLVFDHQDGSAGASPSRDITLEVLLSAALPRQSQTLVEADLAVCCPPRDLRSAPGCGRGTLRRTPASAGCDAARFRRPTRSDGLSPKLAESWTIGTPRSSSRS